MPLKIYLNENKYDAKYYFNSIINFDKDRKIDILFYFIPFIFSDNKQIKEESTFAFVLKEKNNIESLKLMLKYNRLFNDIVKLDPIIRVQELQKLINKKTNIKAYEYYNLALSYTQIYNYKKAYTYFLQAYKLDKANKLYNVLTLVSAIKADIKIKKHLKIEMTNNLLTQKGKYKFFAHKVYKIIMDKNFKIDENYISMKIRNSIFYRSLTFLENNQINSTKLLDKDIKDPLVFLFRTLIKKKSENSYEYISRLQDYIPKHYNDYFIKGPLIITDYYIDLLKALGIFYKVNFEIKIANSPTYLRTKALINLYKGKPVNSIKIIEELQEKYKIDDKNTFTLLIASYLSVGDYSNASATLGMLQFELKDKDAKFLNAVQLLNNLKLSSAKQSLIKKYKGKLIDIKMKGFDKFLENL
jgi:hypothetical protein